jgi:hypothetical protein
MAESFGEVADKRSSTVPQRILQSSGASSLLAGINRDFGFGFKVMTSILTNRRACDQMPLRKFSDLRGHGAMLAAARFGLSSTTAGFHPSGRIGRCTRMRRSFVRLRQAGIVRSHSVLAGSLASQFEFSDTQDLIANPRCCDAG